MASPQKENGYTPIANEILEELVKIDLLGAELRVLLFIIRKTYGYRKKQDRISFTQFEKGTRISRQTINKTIKNLMAKGLIVKICLPGGNIGYSFIKDHDNWVVKTHLLVKGKWETSQDVFTKTSKDVLTYKRKKEIQKKDTLSYLEEIPEEDLQEFYERFDCSKSAIQSKAESLKLYCQQNGYKYKDYKAFLLNALKKDFKPRQMKENVVREKVGIPVPKDIKDSVDKILGKFQV